MAVPEPSPLSTVSTLEASPASVTSFATRLTCVIVQGATGEGHRHPNGRGSRILHWKVGCLRAKLSFVFAGRGRASLRSSVKNCCGLSVLVGVDAALGFQRELTKKSWSVCVGMLAAAPTPSLAPSPTREACPGFLRLKLARSFCLLLGVHQSIDDAQNIGGLSHRAGCLETKGRKGFAEGLRKLSESSVTPWSCAPQKERGQHVIAGCGELLARRVRSVVIGDTVVSYTSSQTCLSKLPNTTSLNLFRRLADAPTDEHEK